MTADRAIYPQLGSRFVSTTAHMPTEAVET